MLPRDENPAYKFDNRVRLEVEPEIYDPAVPENAGIFKVDEGGAWSNTSMKGVGAVTGVSLGMQSLSKS